MSKKLDEKNLLVTGGSGLLGSELQKLFPRALFPSSKEFDITDDQLISEYLENHSNITTIFHAAAFTSPPEIDENPQLAVEKNIIGTAFLVRLCLKKNLKLIYVSTDYVYPGETGQYKETDPVLPINKYAWSKLGGECSVRLLDESLIIRTTFGPNTFPYEKAFVDQWTSRESVSIIASKMAELIRRDASGIFNVGGKRKTVKDFAIELGKDDVQDLSRNEVSFLVPEDTSLDTSKYDLFLKENNKK